MLYKPATQVREDALSTGLASERQHFAQWAVGHVQTVISLHESRQYERSNTFILMRKRVG